MKKSNLNWLIYSLVVFLAIFGLSCLVISFTVCSHAWIISAISLPIALALTTFNLINKAKIKTNHAA